MTTEDDFQNKLDAEPDDWQTRLVFADWLEERGDPRAAGYRAIAVQRRWPLRGSIRGDAWWWYCPSLGHPPTFNHNTVARDWFALLPAGVGSNIFWPVLTDDGGNLSRRACEDALARVFALLPAERQAALLTPSQGEPA